MRIETKWSNNNILNTSDLKMQKNNIFSFLYLEYDFLYAQQLLNVTNIMGFYWVG